MAHRLDTHANQPFFKHLFHRLEETGLPLARMKDVSYSIFSGITPLSGGDAYDEHGNGIPFIRSGEILENGLVSENTELNVKVEIHDGLMRRSQLHIGDLLIAIVGATIGKVGVYNHDRPANINQAIAVVRLDSERVVPEYLAAFLMTKTGQHILDWLKRPVARANINLEEVGDIVFPLPPLTIQRQLVTEMEKARESRRRKLAEADVLLAGLDSFLLDRLGLTPKRTLFPRFFAAKLKDSRRRCDPDYHSPKFKELRGAIEASGYPVYDLGTIAPNPKTGFAAGREAQAFNEDEGIPHVRPLNVTNYGELTFEDTKLVPRKSIQPNDILQSGEVLLNNTNSTEWVGKTTVFEGQRECCCSNHMTRLMPNSSLVIPWFLASILNAMRSTGYLGIVATNFVNQAGINTDTLSALRLPIPDLSTQQEIVDVFIHRRMEARRLRKEAAREWDEAKARFEARLLGNETTP